MAAEPTEMSNEPEHAPFDPKPFLKTIRTKNGMQQYLPTAPRVAWLRNDHPDAQIVTEALRMDEKGAAFKCTITIPSTGAVATGHGTETPGDFGDFIEKAETKAVGRACVTLGYGTLQAGNDFDEIDRTVDAPQDVPTTRPARAQGRPEPTPIRPSPITEENDLHGHDVKWAKVFEIIDFSYLQDPAKTGTDLAEAIRGLSRANGLSAYGFLNYVAIVEAKAKAAGTIETAHIYPTIDALPKLMGKDVVKFLDKVNEAEGSPLGMPDVLGS